MTVYLIQDSFEQPLQTDSKNTIEAIDTSASINELTENEDDPAPQCEGEEFASTAEAVESIKAAYKLNKNLQTKLLKYSQRKIVETMGGKNDGRLLPEDIVEEAIYRIINGDRKWYKSRVKEIDNLIYLVILSLIRIEAARLPDIENQLFDERESGIENKKRIKQTKKIRVIPLHYNDNTGKQMENTVIDNEQYKNNYLNRAAAEFDFEQLDEEQAICSLEKELEDEETAFFVFQEILDGNKSNIDIARKLEVEVKEVENARKRIKRKILKITTK